MAKVGARARGHCAGPGLAQAEQLLGVDAADGVMAAAGEVCGLLAVGKVQFRASTAIAESPNSVRNLRLR